MAHDRATSDPEIWRKAGSFGMAGEEVDGMDVLAVRAAERAIERARAGEGPTLLECLTYRFRGHSLADPDELRAEQEKQFWAERILSRHSSAISRRPDWCQADELRAIERKSMPKSEIVLTLSAPEPDPEELTRYIWAED